MACVCCWCSAPHRIVKARRQPATEEKCETSAPNAFANISLIEKPAAPTPAATAAAPAPSTSPAKSTNLFAKALGGTTGGGFLFGSTGSSFPAPSTNAFGPPLGGSVNFADYTSGTSTFVSSFTTAKADGAKSGASGKGGDGEVRSCASSRPASW